MQSALAWRCVLRFRASLLGFGLCCSLLGCRSLPPTDEWVRALDKGLKEPAGTFATFRAAFCADALELEFRCLDPDFRRELYGGDHLLYREARDRLLEEQPYLRYVLAQAEVEQVEFLNPREARLVARAAGRTIHVRLVRVDYWEIRGESEVVGATQVLDGDYIRDTREILHPGTSQTGEPVLGAVVPLASAQDGPAASTLEVGSEWKIAGFEVRDGEGSR